jgi:crotonobetainyl-CoA:carnitine CoA-transferase CaiB-like acyl-CoA transferase
MDELLQGIRVVELGDECAEYVGLLLAGLGAEVVKVEPPGGSPSRALGPFLDDIPGGERSLHFWAYNRGKQSIVLDLASEQGRQVLGSLVDRADVLVDSTPRDFLGEIGVAREELVSRHPRLVIARLTDFGDSGPWSSFRASDLVHLALGGEMMNCGYSPRPDGSYDLPPMAGQVWQAFHIAGEQLALGTVAALYYRDTGGTGQIVSCAVHEAAAKNTEIDVMTWVFRRAPVYRQTSQHAAESTSLVPPIVHTKDGRWYMIFPGRDMERLKSFAARYGVTSDTEAAPEPAERVGRPIPGSGDRSRGQTEAIELMQRVMGRFTSADAPWQAAQEAGLLFCPIRHPEENVADPQWTIRGTFADVHHPELGRSFKYVTSKWLSTETAWKVGRRAPLLNEDAEAITAWLEEGESPRAAVTSEQPRARTLSARGLPFALDGVRVFDFSWFLASAGGTRFLAAMGAEVIKVEWATHPDTRMGAMSPVGGREARSKATSPLPAVNDPNMGGQFNNKNAGKRGISLNVGHPEGLEIARRLIAISDVVAEGFSPGVMERWGLGYEALQELRPGIIYAAQSGMGAKGVYGRYRAVGPIAASLAGITDMCGLPEPALPAGWGYSYLDWIGAYSFALALVNALYYRARTGKGQYIDASQTEAGIFLCGVPILDHGVNGRRWKRTGNRSPYQDAAPHGVYPCAGDDRWLALACFNEGDWDALVEVAGHDEWRRDERFASLKARMQNQDSLDDVIGRWTQTCDAYQAMGRLQEAGVAAGVCQTAEDRADHDPQLAELEWMTEVTGTKIGTWPVGEVPFKMSATPPYIGGLVNRGAPCYGEDNEYVLGELLGYGTREIARLADDGVI